MRLLRPGAITALVGHRGAPWATSLLVLVIFYAAYQQLASAGTFAIGLPAPVSHETAHSGSSGGSGHSSTLVVARLLEDDTSWVDMAAAQLPHLTAAVYTVDDANASLTVATNKGNEVMVYLTYIIDHYAQLPDVSIFMHAHQRAWHNNDFLDWDSYLTVERLRTEHVVQRGYVNMRCHLDPGCPDHIHPTTSSDAGNNNDLLNIPEAAVIGNSWQDLFPGQPVPTVLSQPCCAQFAVSAERIRSVPLSDYVGYQRWLLETPLSNHLSGRVWEYVWQFLFTGQWEFCPDEVTCYCQEYGICFEEAEYQEYFTLRKQARSWEAAIKKLEEGNPDSLKEATGPLKSAAGAHHRRMDEIKKKARGF